MYLLSNCHRYQLDVEATDGGVPRRIGVTQIAVQVVNVNDNNPRFDRSFYTEEVSEGKHMQCNDSQKYCIQQNFRWTKISPSPATFVLQKYSVE